VVLALLLSTVEHEGEEQKGGSTAGAKEGSTRGRGKVAEGVVGDLVFCRLYLWEPVLSLVKLG
jgi:hypothetical protein